MNKNDICFEDINTDQTENMLIVSESAMNILLQYKNIFDKLYFTTYCNKEDLKLQISKTLVKNLDSPDDAFSVFSWADRNEKSLCKNEVLSVLKEGEPVIALETMCRWYFLYCRYEICEGDLENNGIILYALADKFVVCIKSYAKVKVGSIEPITNILVELVLYLIGNITKMTANNMNEKQPNFYNIHRILILKFKHFYGVQTKVIEDITKHFISLSKYADLTRTKQLNGIHSAMFATLLNIITEMLEISTSQVVIDDDSEVNQFKYRSLYDALNQIIKYLPDYLEDPALEIMNLLV